MQVTQIRAIFVGRGDPKNSQKYIL